MSDIVTRLREVACDNRWCGNEPHCRLCDAINEIERLRSELQNTWKLVDAVQECLNPHDCEFCLAKAKALRGE